MTTLAALAAVQAMVTSGSPGATVVISPTVCVTFAILLCWGLDAAAVAQLAAMGVLIWRRRMSVRQALLTSGQNILAFAAAAMVLPLTGANPFQSAVPTNLVGDMVVVVAAVAAWLLVFGILVLVADWLQRGRLRLYSAGVVGHQVLFKAALLLLSPMLAIAANINVAFVPLVLVPLYAVERMARLVMERERAARVDPLTGLVNRAELKDRFDEFVATEAGRTHRGRTHREEQAPATNTQVAMYLLDLDRFKHVNEALGHEVGDQLIVAVATRLEAIGQDRPMGDPDRDRGDGRARSIVARLGGDEFAMVALVHNEDEPRHLGDTLVSALHEPVNLDGVRIDVTASVGVAVRRGPHEDFATLMRHADVAMYEAKHHGDTMAIYDPSADHGSPRRLGLLTDFRRALESEDREQIRLYYQPQVSLRTGQVVGVEALLRWQHPAYGLVSTQELLHLAEHTSVMQLLTRHVVSEVVAQVARWAAQGVLLRASLNVSARDLYNGQLVAQLAEELHHHQVPAEQVQVEITESALTADPERALATTRRLAALGVGIALDDFGTGYSSLQHLRKMPLRELKIDRSFVSGMLVNADDAAIVASTVEMARALGLRTVAEGVENEDIRAMLDNIGCTLAQGWLIAAAMSGDDIPGWLARYRPGWPAARSDAAPPSAADHANRTSV